MSIRKRHFCGGFSLWLIAMSLATAGFGGVQEAQAGERWRPPHCTMVKGTYAVTFTADEGATLAATDPAPAGINDHNFGLVALQTPNILLAVHNRSLQRSTDAGCRWTILGEIDSFADSFPPNVTAAPGRRAYVWANGRNDLARIDGITITYLKSPVSGIVGLAADRGNAKRVRLGGDNGTLWESTDGGASWRQIGKTLPNAPPLIYHAEFDRKNLEHVLFAVAASGAYVTDDGGNTWSKSSGLSSTGTGKVNVFRIVASSSQPRTIWAMGIDLAEADARMPSDGRHIYLSRDGGITFKAVVDQSADVSLVNGPTMAAHPTDSHILYFVFGSSYQKYGTDLYRYDDRTHKITKAHNGHDEINAIAFNPADPKVMYLGLAWERMTQRASK
jgi:photosystem II stability/assembly factor-like uncharacterized protein